MKRSVDFLQSRPDTDAEKIAYSGFSWGGQVAKVMARQFKEEIGPWKEFLGILG